MSIRCGHCKGRHETTLEVWACSRVHRGIQAAVENPPAQVAQEAPLEPGLYHAGTKVYRLAEDRSWALLSSSGRWMEGAAAPYRPARMTVEEVAALGRRHVRCIVCGVRLKKAESVAAGIGPVCATRV